MVPYCTSASAGSSVDQATVAIFSETSVTVTPPTVGGIVSGMLTEKLANWRAASALPEVSVTCASRSERVYVPLSA